ncbi:ribonuclease T2-like [Orbilia brochopaga]|uniref:Ribonuclease T2-like n=1 Tax=Orbilia brochopaga TaxID=3140254 RepID=A0AAV9U8I3_9PEZI
MHYSRILSSAAVLSYAVASPLNLYSTRADAPGPTCSKADSSELSCHSTANVSNTCCFNSPGGQILLTQFWDSKPVAGPVDSWTLHGLWPDNCDGTWEQFCDKTRESKDITAVMNKFGRTETLAYMQKYWKSNDGKDDSFWQHEWNKHGTCMSTFEPKCYTDYQEGQEIADFMDKAVEIFKTVDTYKILSAAGITPSTSKTYTLDDLQAAAKKVHGQEVVFNCKNGVISEVWYHYNVYGSAQSGKYVPAPVVGSPSTCPKTGIKYPPKDGKDGDSDGGSDGGSGGTPTATPPGPTDSPAPGPTATGSPSTGSPSTGEEFSGRGYLNVDKGGCLISSGKWYTKGTCATYTAAGTSSGFTLKSSKGACGLVNGRLECGADVTGATFTASDGKLVSDGSPSFYASKDATSGHQETVYTNAEGRSVTLAISWKGM